MDPAAIVSSVRAQLRARFPAEHLQRIEGMLEVFAGQREPALAPSQRITSRIFMPDIVNRPWHDAAALPWTARLQAAFPDVREELADLLASEAALVPYGSMYDGKKEGTQIYPAGWNTFYFYRAGRPIADNCARCPRTAGLLDSLGVAQEAMFSVLEPGASIPLHSDGLNFVVTCHLPILVPEGCAIRVGGEERTWVPGECLFLSTSFLHEAWNRSSSRRVVLLVDLWHPELTAQEIAIMRSLRPGIELALGLMVKS